MAPVYEGTRDYTAGSSQRPRIGSSRGIRRSLFFGLASTWGFVVGVGAVLAAMSATGQPLGSRAGIVLGLVPGFTIAVVGGFIIAAAYREAKRRARY